MSQRLVQHLLVRLGLAGAAAGALGGTGVAVAANQNAAPATRGAAHARARAECGELARDLARRLAAAPAFDRLALLGDGATADDAAVRRTLACALAETPDGVGVRSAIEVLARDAAPDVRRAAARAAWAHVAEDPIRYVMLLEALAGDPDAAVRDAVQRMHEG